jgi:hypothetical protein
LKQIAAFPINRDRLFLLAMTAIEERRIPMLGTSGAGDIEFKVKV